MSQPNLSKVGQLPRGGAKSLQLVKYGNTLIGINPSLKSNADVVAVPPNEAAFTNCEKVVKRDVEVRWQKSQLVGMKLRASLAHVIADAGAHFSAKEKQSTNWLSDHLQSNLRYVAALALVL